ncbi:C40 family peptidase [Chelativorans sp. YIM 93263]|uniref:C40 family peptidase n=1 Tax=Chelativorans sp. YIM 93263 TaxID=2906648 RepID=UPI002379F91C|nr:NlpC/P60 family protein [Chelativorans sp. YIM 93263]
MSTQHHRLDRRLNAFRPDLADEDLKRHVEATRFTVGEPAAVAAPVASVHQAPDASAGMDTQFLHGDTVRVFERKDGWAWVQNVRDNYVGYVRESELGDVPQAPTHIVCIPRSFVYPEADMKAPPVRTQSIGARLAVRDVIEKGTTRYALLESGEAMIAPHLRLLDEASADFVSVAEAFLGTPYLWGGASGFGIDCSGLVQLSLFMAGREVPRDTDMQEAALGSPISEASMLSRGDLVFWRGHVAIMMDGKTVVHANGYTMTVSQESLAEAIQRITPLYGQPTGYRRL